MALRASLSPESSVSVSRRSTQLAQRVDFAAQVGVDVFAFVGQIKVRGNVVDAADQVGLGGQHVFEALFLAHHLLGFLGIRPEVRVGSLLFDFG